MTTQYSIVPTFIKRIATALVVVILLIPVYFLFSLQLTLFDRSDYVFARSECSTTIAPIETGAGVPVQTEAPHRRLGDYYDPGTKTWHCSGGGGGDATSCDGGSDGGGLPRTQRIPPSPPITPGTINAFAVFTTTPDDISTCDKLERYKTSGDHFLSPTELYFELYGPYIQTTSAGATAIVSTPYTYNAVAFYPNVEAPNPSYASYIYCNKNATDASWTAGNFFSVKTGDTITVNVGFITPPLPWFQITGGGDTYANKLYSRMPLQNTLTMFFDKTAATRKVLERV